MLPEPVIGVMVSAVNRISGVLVVSDTQLLPARLFEKSIVALKVGDVTLESSHAKVLCAGAAALLTVQLSRLPSQEISVIAAFAAVDPIAMAAPAARLKISRRMFNLPVIAPDSGGALTAR